MSYFNMVCDSCGREVYGCNIVNGMKFCAKCYQETFGETDKDKQIAELKKQLRSQPAEIVEKIRNLAEKDFDFDTCTCCGEDVHDDVVLTKNDFNKILDKVLKKYGEK